MSLFFFRKLIKFIFERHVNWELQWIEYGAEKPTFREADSQEISRLLEDLKVHHCIHKSLPRLCVTFSNMLVFFFG
jgi:hypothetical protein